VVGVSVCLLVVACAKDTSHPLDNSTATPVTIPLTPVGDALRWFLDQANRGAAGFDPGAVAGHLSSAFLARVPPDFLRSQLDAAFAGHQGWAVVAFEAPPTATKATVEVGSGSTVFRVVIEVGSDAPHLIDELTVTPAPVGQRPDVPRSWAEFDRRIDGLGPDVAFVAAEINDDACVPVHALHPTSELAIASAFKLYVLGAVADAVKTGSITWDTSVPIEDRLRAVGGGKLQQSPPGASFTVQTMATYMISISDNTAADHLLNLVGRPAVEAEQTALGHSDPARNTPFPSTREVNALKFALPPTIARQYAAASATERRQLLTDTVDPAPLPQLTGTLAPAFVDSIEWFASPADLCRAMVGLTTLATDPLLAPVRQILSINPGIPFPSQWTYVAFKGGSEPGVTAAAWLLERSDGRRFVIAGAVNNPAGQVDSLDTVSLLANASTLLPA
jgi:hypothetical protein